MDFKHEKEERKAAAEKARLESDKQVELSKLEVVVEFLMVEVEMMEVVVVVKVVEVVVMEVLVIVVSCVEAMTAPE